MFPFLNKLKKSTSQKDADFLSFLKPILGFKPKNIHFYQKAFTHSSSKKVVNGKIFNYERLEFLGDAIIDTIVAAYLYDVSPLKDEGYLTKMRSKIVSRENLNKLGEELDFLPFVQSNVSQDKFGKNIYGNVYEALVGAVFLDKGYDVCAKFVTQTLLASFVDIEELEGKITSYKSVIIEWCQKKKYKFRFTTVEEVSKERIKHFTVQLIINNKVVSKGRYTSKKKAEEIAAKRAYYTFQSRIEQFTK